ncbi:hypothetical protein PMAYCL1PPCAC_12908, partial [Pristionchus mayeri]
QVDLVIIASLNAGLRDLFEPKYGIKRSFLSMVRDMSYYDGRFIRNVILLKHSGGEILEEMTVVFDMIDDVAVSLLYSDTSRPITCKNNLQLILDHVTTMKLPRKSIVLNIQADSPNEFKDGVFEHFVLNRFVFNLITYGDQTCPSDGYSSAKRLVSMTSGFYSDVSTWSFLVLEAIPMLFKSVAVGRDHYENDQFMSGGPI